MQSLYILIGFIGSGKSTWAREKVHAEPETVIISKDRIRDMIKAEYIYDEKLEPLVKQIAGNAIRSALNLGHDVIVDETHLTKNQRFTLSEVVRQNFPGVRIVYVWCPECRNNLDNRMKDPRGYSREKWAGVLREQVQRFEIPMDSEGYDQMEVVGG
jgi:predicted kinase